MVEQSQAEALAAAAAAGDSLICQAIINSGIALETEETVVEETSQTTEEINKVVSDCPDTDEGIIEIQVKEEFVEIEEVCLCFQGLWASRLPIIILCCIFLFPTFFSSRKLVMISHHQNCTSVHTVTAPSKA